MSAAAPKLDRLIRQWWAQFYRVGLAEAACCASAGAAVAALTVLLWLASSGRPDELPRWLLAAAPTVVLVGCLGVGPLRGALSRRSWTFLLALALGWASPWWTVPRLHVAWLGGDKAAPQLLTLSIALGLLNEGVLIFAAAVLAVLVRFTSVPRDAQVSAWLDEQAGTRGLLTTAAELVAGRRQLSPVEWLVVERAEALAARSEPFARVTARRLDGRWWGLLGVLVAGAALAGWIAVSQPPARPALPGREQSGPPAAVETYRRQQSAQQLYQLATAADAAGESELADSAQTASAAIAAGRDPSAAQAAIEQVRARAEARLAGARPLLEALAGLAEQPAGSAVAAVLAEPDQPTARAVASARRQADDWRATNMSAADRARLAEQLRQAARQASGADPELAARLNQSADALVAQDWTALADQLEAIVRRIQPVARGVHVAQTALRAMDQALGAVGPGRSSPAPAGVALAPAPPPQAGPDADGTPPPDDLRWHAARDAAWEALHAQSLTPPQQQAVRRYFALGE